MDTTTKIIFFLLFMVIGAGLYLWGVRKSVNMRQDTTRMLLQKCAGIVLKQLKKQDTITEKEVSKLISGVTAGPAWSRRKAIVQDSHAFAGTVMEFLTEQHYVERSGNGYRLRK